MQAFSFPYQQSLKHQLPEGQQRLVAAAQAAAQKAYAPYSLFKVGAAVLLSGGDIITGANHENASLPAGICAERAVLASIPMDEAHKISAIAIAYLPPADTEHHPPLSPCGICRQTILEAQQFQQAPIQVFMSSPDGTIIMVEDASFLLPFHFGKEFL